MRESIRRFRRSRPEGPGPAAFGFALEASNNEHPRQLIEEIAGRAVEGVSMSFRFRRFLFAAPLLSALIVPSLRADVTATILGNARDSSGAAVPGVKVTAINVDTNLSQTTLTDSAGEYRFL